MIQFEQNIINKIKSLPFLSIIAISGFGGSGKSSVAEILSKQLNTPVISIDSFFTNKSYYSTWNVIDFNRFLKEVIEPFNKNTNPISYGVQMYGDENITEKKEVSHDGTIIIEGVGLFRPELGNYFNYKIWVDVPIEEAVKRGKKRDREVYNNPNDEQWEGIWKQNDIEYFEKYKPRDIADLVINNN